MSDAYELSFELDQARVNLKIWNDGKTCELATLSSQYRRRGKAGAVLQKALDYADFLNLEVVLEVQPFGDGIGMRDHELKAWYMSFGFQSEGNNIMARPAIKDRLLSEEANHADEEDSPSPSGSGPRLVRGPDRTS